MERNIKNYTLLTFDLRGASEKDYEELEKFFKKLKGEKLATTTWIFPITGIGTILKSKMKNKAKNYTIIEIYNGEAEIIYYENKNITKTIIKRLMKNKLLLLQLKKRKSQI